MIVAIADTHAAIWYISNDRRLSHSARDFITNAANQGHEIGISSISLVEMVYLVEKGKIAASEYDELVKRLENPSLFNEVSVTLKIAQAMRGVSAKQIPDMPDRIIAATALSLNIPIISRDGRIRVSSLNTIW